MGTLGKGGPAWLWAKKFQNERPPALDFQVHIMAPLPPPPLPDPRGEIHTQSWTAPVSLTCTVQQLVLPGKAAHAPVTAGISPGHLGAEAQGGSFSGFSISEQVSEGQVVAGEMPMRAPDAVGCRRNATQLGPFLHRTFYTGRWLSAPLLLLSSPGGRKRFPSVRGECVSV